ncbi:hypothetical protein K2173_018101 [Erythroxylum novogranatense]|uniref:Uncharacterized protein n=1 Tax=Erythroxylum novogranatense TaxID=1862640 RepID=A0AAV8U695_9ROSI|nr:hypothetical protein K2173_018101 [Erythroxylum novogranatense]
MTKETKSVRFPTNNLTRHRPSLCATLHHNRTFPFVCRLCTVLDPPILCPLSEDPTKFLRLGRIRNSSSQSVVKQVRERCTCVRVNCIR